MTGTAHAHDPKRPDRELLWRYTAPPRTAMRDRVRSIQHSGLWRRLALSGGIVMLCLIYLPIVWLILMSFSGRPLSGMVDPWTTRWYELLFTDLRWAAPLKTSVLIALAVALFCMVAATAVGRAIPRLQRPGGIVLLAILPLFVPGLTMGVALFLFFRTTLGLKLGGWSLMLGHIVWAFPMALLLVLVLATRFDRRLTEAASDLGASPLQSFWHIEFPIMRPAIVGAGIFGFLLSFNELLRSIFLRGGNTTLPVFQWADVSSHQSQIPTTFALATIILAVTLPLLSVFFWFLFSKLDKDDP